MAIAVPFPTELPSGYDWLDDEPAFDPARHLALEEPDEIVELTDLGYRPDEIVGLPTPVAASSPFRVLSDEGAAVMLDIGRRLRAFANRADTRIENMTRAGCYRSRWLRDLCLSPDVTELMSGIYRTPIAPHPMVSHLGHLNYEPSRIEHAVDKWHHDTLPLDYVMMVTDPAETAGGEFEYFIGTKAEAAELASQGETPPRDRVVQPSFPGPGHAIALHGNMVVHRGGPLRELGERMTMVNGYVAMDAALPAQSRTQDLIGIDDDAFLYTDWARFVAWRSAERLQALVDDERFDTDPAVVIARLEHAIEDVRQAVDEMRAGRKTADHYE